MSTPPNPEVAILNAALELPPEERPTYLDKACVDDGDLRRRVEGLLEAHEQVGDFLETPPTGLDTANFLRTSVSVVEKPGDRIGPYKLLEQIGEGGCGVVYMAEQEEPVRRRVALKVIKLGMDTKSVIARFEAERQALALMDHPNIARVLDAGATDTGRPYFVMELVRGIKITEYCDENNLPTQERLRLFTQVCHAIQHAHQKGIIHRDIKPSNILVTVNDGVPVPKVIDFGIAKAAQGRLTDQTLFTAFEQFLGTPAYMSPEQAVMTSLDIDTRSDIYSLGVLLYELLTGRTPFEQKDLLAAGVDEMRRTICEKQPPKPSTRLSNMVKAELNTTANRRQTEPPRLILTVRGDLDWIVMKALEKDRARRYPTANGLAMDVQRHLNDEPIVARPPDRLYLLGKLVRRNKVAVAACTVTVAGLLIGLTVSTTLYEREKRAERASRIAEAKRGKVARFLQDMLDGVGPEVALGRDPGMLKGILDKTKLHLRDEMKDQPDVEAELRGTIAGIYRQLGDFVEAEKQYRETLRLLDQVHGTENEAYVEVLNHLAETMMEREELADAEGLIRRGLSINQKLFGQVHTSVADSLHTLGMLRWRQGDLAGADELQRQALAQWRQLHDPENVSMTLNDLGLVLLDRGNLADAQASFTESLELRRKLLPPEHPAIAVALNNVALALWYRGDLAQAEQKQREALAMRRKLFGDDQPAETASSLHNLALVLRDRGNFPESGQNERQALTIVVKALGKDHPHALLVRNSLATILRRSGAAAADPALLRESLSLNPTDPLTADALARLLGTNSFVPVVADSATSSVGWRYSSAPQDPKWFAPDFDAAAWPFAPTLHGAATFIPRTPKTPIEVHTNLYLRREFDLTSPPQGTLVFQLNRNHDGQIFLNGDELAPTADWNDAWVTLQADGTGRPALIKGRNVLAVHCQDADCGAPIGVSIFITQDPDRGRERLLEEMNGMIQREPERADLYAGRAGAFARMGRWPEATADLSKAVELRPSDSTQWYQLGSLLVTRTNLPAYERHRHEALAKFASPADPQVAERIARLSLLLPAAGADLDQAAKLADLAARAQYPDANLAWRQFTAGLADYRRRRFDSAVAWLRKTLESSRRQNLPGWTHERERNRCAAAYLVEAMALQQLHQPEAAQAALKAGTDIVRLQFPARESGNLGREWPDWLIAHVLLREVSTRIETK
jgi:serine/threonine protein kinase/tetratricopeptide (TPR) repeat protein